MKLFRKLGNFYVNCLTEETTSSWWEARKWQKAGVPVEIWRMGYLRRVA